MSEIHQTKEEKKRQEEAIRTNDLKYRVETFLSVTKFFTDWEVLLAWLEEQENVPFYVYHYYRKAREEKGEIKPTLWWLVTRQQFSFIKKNPGVRWGGEKKANRKVLDARKKSRKIITRTQKLPLPGIGRYPKGPRKLEYRQRMEERDAIDEAERRGEIDELTQEEVEDPEAWKVRRLGVKERE